MTQLNVQALEALDKANKTRIARAADKRAIRNGDLDPVAVLMDPPEYWGSAKLVDLFLSMPRIGRQRANRWCTIEMVSPARRLDALTERQRTMLGIHIDVWCRKRDALRVEMEEAA
ncbi:hypothetical protein UFOVP1313_37 [uncultured Caudovirales phage]|uniref:Uncharacterized protein n=1 Tax=uncultured Caudovirales phage TaxID=2100421 RepID=A0A6J5RLN9_9CAUD|nr:hypothetical protein UFOVP1313_37 [uncultured Caudovirales phage]